MKPSTLAFLVIPLLINYCSFNPDDQQPPISATPHLVVKTIDSLGHPKVAKLIYEQINCEYDFANPKSAVSNNRGITILKLDTGYLQIYVEGHLYESYVCFNNENRPDTLTLYAASIPTYVEVKDFYGRPVKNGRVTYFSNKSGNCDYEQKALGKSIKTDRNGKAIIYLPQGDTYKIQIKERGSRLIECFQPDQEVHTLKFTVKC